MTYESSAQFAGSTSYLPNYKGRRSAYGAIIRDLVTQTKHELSEYLGDDGDCHCAEYIGLIRTLEWALSRNYRSIIVYGSGGYATQHMQNKCRPGSPNMIVLHGEATRLSRKFDRFAIEQIPKELNFASALARKAAKA